MKKILLTSFALAALAAGPAVAADMPVKAAPAKAAYSWTACYLGIHGGWGYGEAKVEHGANTLGITAGTHASSNIHPKGPEFGGTAGCDWDWGGGFVIGLLGDAAWIPKDDQKVEGFRSNFHLSAKEDWLATARARIGIVMGTWGLWYITGGGAFTDIEIANYNILGSPFVIAKNSQSRFGWTAGWGAEYPLTPNLSLKTETLYMDFGRKTYFSASDPITLSEFRVKQTQWVSKIGLNWRFSTAPVAVRAAY